MCGPAIILKHEHLFQVRFCWWKPGGDMMGSVYKYAEITWEWDDQKVGCVWSTGWTPIFLSNPLHLTLCPPSHGHGGPDGDHSVKKEKEQKNILININSSFQVFKLIKSQKQSRDWQKGTLRIGPWLDKEMILFRFLIWSKKCKNKRSSFGLIKRW